MQDFMVNIDDLTAPNPKLFTKLNHTKLQYLLS